MPIYEYQCHEHGAFEQQRPVSDFLQAGVCPVCHKDSPRILSAPGLRLTESSERIARDRNERSQHEPRVAVRPREVSGRSSPFS